MKKRKREDKGKIQKKHREIIVPLGPGKIARGGGLVFGTYSTYGTILPVISAPARNGLRIFLRISYKPGSRINIDNLLPVSKSADLKFPRGITTTKSRNTFKQDTLKKRCPYKTSPHKTSPHKTSPVTKRHPTKRHLAQNVTSTKRHQKTSPVTKRHLIVAVSTMRNNMSQDIIAVGTMRNPPVLS